MQPLPKGVEPEGRLVQLGVGAEIADPGDPGHSWRSGWKKSAARQERRAGQGQAALQELAAAASTHRSPHAASISPRPRSRSDADLNPIQTHDPTRQSMAD